LAVDSKLVVPQF